jgi:hypothetical protein
VTTKTKVVIAAVVAFVVVDVVAITTGHGDMMGPVVVMLVLIPGYLLPTIIAARPLRPRQETRPTTRHCIRPI